jgi:Zn-dependent peptidase ImmA (M78 family)/predicted secreted protein
MAASAAALLRRQTAAKALQTRRALKIPMDRPADVYEAIRKMRLWLLFEPMDGLFGMYQRYGHASGIAISVKVHPALQRFTAAHELGHHVLGHEVSFDSEHNITSWRDLDNRELAAQMFAAEFLMPLAAMNAVASAIGFDKGHVDPIGVYQMSLRLGTSYSAMIARLQTLTWIRAGQAERLRQVTPQQVKLQLLGHPLRDSRSDVWLITDRREHASISPMVGDEVVLRLRESPSTGFRWHSELDEGLETELDTFEAAPQMEGHEVIGGTGRRLFHFAVTDARSIQANVALRRRWEQRDPVSSVMVSMAASPRPVSGVDLIQQPALLAS